MNSVALTLGRSPRIICHMRVLPLPDRKYRKEFVIEEDPSKARKVREDITTYDILYFIECLGKDRDVHYSDNGAPDVAYRNDPQPDRLVKDEKTGRQIAIEHAELHESQEYVEKLNYEIEKYWWTSGPPPSPHELAARLLQMIDEKKSKRQFTNYPDSERIILFRDRCTSGTTKDFLECAKYLALPDNPGCDHCYVLLSSGAVLEVV